MKFNVIQGRIEEQNVECIVNSTNAELVWEETTVNGDILRKAGIKLINEFQYRHKKYGNMNVGDLFVTSGYNCPAKLICHVYSPWYGYNNYFNELKELYKKIFKSLYSIGITEIALPLIGTGGL